MELIMNERKESENILANGNINTNTASKLFLLAKYYRSIGESTQQIRDSLSCIMADKYNNYNPDDWDEIIQRYSDKSANYNLVEIDEIPITKNELKTISQINNKKLEKVAFTILVLAKFCNMKNPNNNNWVLVDEYSVLKRARITGTIQAQFSCFYELSKMDLITYSRKVDNINVRVGFIDNSSNVVLKITDLRELGYQYLMYRGEKFIKCAECGIVTRATAHNKRYCKNCAGYQPIVSKVIKCCDCGIEFEVSGNSRKIRCDKCHKRERQRINRENVSKYREKSDM